MTPGDTGLLFSTVSVYLGGAKWARKVPLMAYWCEESSQQSSDYGMQIPLIAGGDVIPLV